MSPSEERAVASVNVASLASLGSGTGNWRLKFTSDLNIDIGGFFRNTDGFVNSLHEVVDSDQNLTHSVVFFNPASNTNQVSRLRIVNISDSTHDSHTGWLHSTLSFLSRRT